MSWLGKILGGGIGFVLGGPLGGVMGAVMGHQFDSKAQGRGILSAIESKQSIYFAATFSMLGKLAKADGFVSQAEVDVIERVMRDKKGRTSSGDSPCERKMLPVATSDSALLVPKNF